MTSLDYFGIDVSKAHLDVSDTNKYLRQFKNTPSGHKALVEWLKKHLPCQIGVEATGIYSQSISETLADAGYTVFVVQPGRVRKYAQSQGILAKTDAIDGVVIARFIKHSQNLRAFAPPSALHKELRDQVTRRDQLVEDRKREKNRLEACLNNNIARSIRKSIKRFDEEIKDIEKVINGIVKSDAELTNRSNILSSVCGVGVQVAAVILAHLMEIGTLNRQEIAALSGMAPYNADSGKHTGKRAIYGGRSRVRSALYMSALSAARYSPPLNEVYQRLLKAGKEKKVAQIAIARKLLVHLNSKMKTYLQEQQCA